MSNPLVVQCEKFEGEICFRYSPREPGEVCMRCGHIERCHCAVDVPTGQPLACWFIRVSAGCVPAMPEYPSYAERLKQQLESDAVEAILAREMRIWQETGELPGSSKLEPLTKDQVRDRLAMPSAPRSWPFGATQAMERQTKAVLKVTNATPEALGATAPALTIANLKLAKMRFELYDGIVNLEKDEGLRGFHLAKVYMRPGEWERLMAAECRFKDENPPKMESGQVGSLWVHTTSANVPVFESAWLPETFHDACGRLCRTICLLEYEHQRELLGIYRWPTQLFAPETRLRILSE